jgi:hypothetical protein
MKLNLMCVCVCVCVCIYIYIYIYIYICICFSINLNTYGCRIGLIHWILYSLGDCLGTVKEYGVSVDSSYQPQEKQLKRFINKINVEKYEGPVLPNCAANMLIESSRRFEAERYINICLVTLYETFTVLGSCMYIFKI